MPTYRYEGTMGCNPPVRWFRRVELTAVIRSIKLHDFMKRLSMFSLSFHLLVPLAQDFV